MSTDSHETEQHFQTRNLDQDMRDAYAETLKVHPKEHVRRLQAENKGILAFLAIIIVIVAVGGHLLGAF